MIATLSRDPFLRQLDRMRPRVPRSYRQFAEEEIVMPDGPFKGWNYSCDRMPFTAELLDEFGRGRFRHFYGSGPAQGSKTLHFCVIPTLYHLLEINEDVIFGAPTVVMAKAAFEARIRPAIEASDRYRDLLPTRGGGSRGGVADYIRLKNGALIRFLGAGGGDQQLSGYTARVVVATELDKMDEPGEVSRETDPVSKLIARMGSFSGRERFFGECTMSTKGGRIYREVVEHGTDSRVHLPCPHCHRWIFPERSGLVGWSQAVDVMAARDATRFECPNCSGHWTEEQRRAAMRDPRIVARTQSVLEDGKVDGPMPNTLTYGFRWNAMSSPLKEMADVGAKEWRAERGGMTSEEKELCQFEWVIPWEENIEDLIRPDEKSILAKIEDNTQLTRGVIPPDTQRLTMGIDVGSYVIWYSLVAWGAEGRGHVVDFKGIDVPDAQKRNPLKILAMLRDFRDRIWKLGWGEAKRQPDLTLIDSGYEQEAVYSYVLESGQGRWFACKGFGTNSRNGMWRTGQAEEPTERRAVGNEWKYVLQPTGIRLVAVHSDHWRGLVHDGFWAPRGAPGSITLPHAAPNDRELGIFARQIVAEQREYTETANRERKIVWAVKSRINHYLDCMTYARCAADMLGIKLAAQAPRPPRAIVEARPLTRKIRTRY